MLEISPKHLFRVALGATVISAFLLPSSAIAQPSAAQFERYLFRLDQNSDGFLSPDEISGRTEDRLRELGLTVGDRMAISTVLEAFEKRHRKKTTGDDSQKTNNDDNSSFATDIPRFSDFETPDPTPIQGMGLSKSRTSTDQPPEREYPDYIVRRVARTFRTYDRNEDDILDADEMRLVHWGPPSPEKSDLNGDGQLSRAEMLERTFRRDEGFQNSRGDDSDRDNRFSRRRRERRRERDSSRGSNDDSRPAGRDNDDRQERESSSDKDQNYARWVMKRYDADGNGELSSDEIDAMRRKPRGADQNDDGVLDMEELHDHYDRRSQESSSESENTRSKNRFNRRSDNSARRDADTRDNKRAASPKLIRDRDADGDGQVSMAEFTDTWTDEKLAEYHALDLNHDGFITPVEMRESVSR